VTGSGNRLFGGIEAGGTKWRCVVGRAPEEIRAELRVPTTTPAATLEAVVGFFRRQQAVLGPIISLGIGSFGPVDLHRGSTRYGFITATPKPGWADTDIVGPLRRALGVPVAFETDVNAAAVGEGRYGTAQGLETFLYLTVGTGIGGGAFAGGRVLHGLVHPEMGHVRVPHDRSVDPFPGICPFHGDCLEGLASGPAMAARWGMPADVLPPDHPGWALEAHYLALALHGFVCTFSPQRIVIGGGVMEQPHLLPRIRLELGRLLNGYIQSPVLTGDLAHYVVAPGLGRRAGVVGALWMAELAVTAPP
jgi:fructokinase